MSQSFSPSGASYNSRATAGVFQSRWWLDRPLPTAKPNHARLVQIKTALQQASPARVPQTISGRVNGPARIVELLPAVLRDLTTSNKGGRA